MSSSLDYGKIYLVTGGSASGKSEYAENLAVSLSGKNPLVYLATMSARDAESLDRIKRHRENRRGRGFLTAELPMNVSRLETDGTETILLEDLSNLLANEMFSAGGDTTRIFDDIIRLSTKCSALVIVTNEIFTGCCGSADEYTKKYIFSLARLNREIAEISVQHTEVVCSIPISLKGEV